MDDNTNARLGSTSLPSLDDPIRLWAHYYALHGLAVFPCHGKRPLTTRGFHDASLDPAQIDAWWTQYSDANIGTPTGNGSFVLDIDPRSDGHNTLHNLEKQHGDLPRTLTAHTGGGGVHKWFLEPSGGVPNKANIGQGIDVQARGSYVILPPSIHPDTGRQYVWALGDGPDEIIPQLAPDWLLDLLTTEASDTVPRETVTEPGAPIPDGTRNNTMARIAGAMRATGATAHEIRTALEAVNERCVPPLAGDEVDRIAISIARYPPNGTMHLGQQAAVALPVVAGSATAPAWESAPDPGAMWQKAICARDFLQQQEADVLAHAKDLVVPGCITVVSAPRASGKSLVALYLAVALATGGIFRDERLTQRRVLLVDRDNPPALVRKRLRWLGAHDVTELKVLTREMAPPLTDKAAWAQFPADEFDLIIVDSLGAATEGISEKEGRQTQEFLATLKDLARRGPALLCLDNTVKAGTNYRGRGEKADAVDILYECRNITGWTPPQGEDWWERLPDFGEHSWQERATRRRGQAVLRVAFVLTKYRLGIEPEPFVLEINTQQEPWTLTDVTKDVASAGTQAAQDAGRQQRAQVTQAESMLVQAISARDPATPMTKSEAEELLCGCGLKRAAARTLLNAGGNHDVYPVGRWVIREIKNYPSGKAQGVYLADTTNFGGRSSTIVSPGNYAPNGNPPPAVGHGLHGESYTLFSSANYAAVKRADLSPKPSCITAGGDTPPDKHVCASPDGGGPAAEINRTNTPCRHDRITGPPEARICQVCDTNISALRW